MRRPPLKKQITLIVSLADWQVLSHEAARQHLSLTELCRRELAPLLDRLNRQGDSDIEFTDSEMNAPVPRMETLPVRNPPHHPWRQPLNSPHNPSQRSLDE